LERFDNFETLYLTMTSTLERPFIEIILLIIAFFLLKINVLFCMTALLPLMYFMYGDILVLYRNYSKRMIWASKGYKISSSQLLTLIEKGAIIKFKITYYSAFDASRLTPSAVAYDGNIIYTIPFMWYSAIEKIRKIKPELIN